MIRYYTSRNEISQPAGSDKILHTQHDLVPIQTWRITVWGTVSMPRWWRTNSKESK